MAKRRAVSVTAKQREELEAVLRRPSSAAGLAKRARAIVLLAEGATVSATGRMVPMQRRHLYKWIERFRQHGVAGLSDGKRTGRPPVFSPRRGDSLGEDRLRTAG
jgi:Helix-turn-helix domain